MSDCHRGLSGRGPTRLRLPSGVSGGRQTSCFLPKKRVFVRRLAAYYEAEVFTAAETVLADPDTIWEDSGLRGTDGPAVLMDSAEAGADRGVGYSDGSRPDQLVSCRVV
ncbi:Imm21 family immunity protein [Streptomyces sp. CAU 1734]|uniref:Imm21 family immunity protein n=1 Tax=Streptomyces sp. CAU 1734 TaxID=3140360 RepID=UPI00326148C9